MKAIYGIIGDPVSHSLSPLLHNTAFQNLGVNALYKTFLLKKEALKDFFGDLKKKDSPIFGLNVTVPYKEKIVEYMDLMSPFAEKVKAVNTIVISKERMLEGFNTDGLGFLVHIKELKFNTQNKRIAVLGAGGTARAIIAALCLLPQRPESIRVFNHHRHKADQLIEDLSQRMDTSIVRSVDTVVGLNIGIADLVINTTPLGMKDDDPCLIDEALLHSKMLVYDVIYHPAETPLLKMAKKKGAQCANGLGMLFYQGILAFQHWANVELNEKIKSKIRQNLNRGALV